MDFKIRADMRHHAWRAPDPTRRLGHLPTVSDLGGLDEADAFVAERVAVGVDYLKVLVEEGFSLTCPLAGTSGAVGP